MRSPQRTTPNVLLFGAPRCASTSLAMALAQHPSMFLCTPKEPHFLAMHERKTEVDGLGKDAFSKANQLSLDQWGGLFAGRDEPCLIDASVSTISYPDTAIENIKRYCGPETKFIAILRNPVERAFSSYQYCLSKGWNGGSFEECLEQEPERIAQNWQHLWFLKSLSQYELRLPPFLDAFGAENVHIVITEEFAARPAPILKQIFGFLDIPQVDIDLPQRFNSGGVPKSRVLGGLTRFARNQSLIRKAVVSMTSAATRDKLKSKTLSKTEMSPATRERLSRDLAQTRPWVEQQIGRKLDLWQ